MRLAIIPGQPVLFGYTPRSSARGVVYLVPEGGHATEVSALKIALEQALDSGQVLSLACPWAERAFADGSMVKRSVHLRVERNGRRWQLYFDRDGCPPQLLEFCDRARALATELTVSLPKTEMSGAEALELVHPREGWRDLVIAVFLLTVLVLVGWLIF